jgi:hypothetical protein
MPTIILQIPSVRMILSHEFSNGYHSKSNSMCTHCGHRQSEEDEIEEDKIGEDYMKKEEIIFQYPFNEEYDSNKYILHNDVNLNEWSLSSLSEANIKDEIYDWKQFLIE